jgi:hypothetical protein
MKAPGAHVERMVHESHRRVRARSTAVGVRAGDLVTELKAKQPGGWQVTGGLGLPQPFAPRVAASSEPRVWEALPSPALEPEDCQVLGVTWPHLSEPESWRCPQACLQKQSSPVSSDVDVVQMAGAQQPGGKVR